MIDFIEVYQTVFKPVSKLKGIYFVLLDSMFICLLLQPNPCCQQ